MRRRPPCGGFACMNRYGRSSGMSGRRLRMYALRDRAGAISALPRSSKHGRRGCAYMSSRHKDSGECFT